MPSSLPPGLVALRERYDAMLIDLDGTLLDAQSAVTARTRRAIDGLRDAGMRVLVCTGRSVGGTVQVHRELELDEPVVAYNGGWIGMPGAEPDQRILIPPHAIEPLYELEEHAEFTFRCDGDHKYTVHSVHADYAAIAAWYERVRTVQRHELPGDDLMRISMFFEGAGTTVDLGAEDLGGMLPDDRVADAAYHEHWDAMDEQVRKTLRREWFPLRIFPPYRHSALELCEVVGWSEGKAEGVLYLGKRYDIPPERVIAVGDQRNDLPMFEAAGLSVAMGNAIPEVKARADLVIGHHADEGLAGWIESGAPLPEREIAP